MVVSQVAWPGLRVVCPMPAADQLSGAGCRGWFHHHRRPPGTPHATAHTTTHITGRPARTPPTPGRLTAAAAAGARIVAAQGSAGQAGSAPDASHAASPAGLGWP